ncbi:hypothetical protein NKY44_17165 [Sinorhizobium meliloti]|uniref:hypothetical protein n=1 Tax=Rhizobium meliloti TaxID=382 RepID=UPI003D64EE5B
MSRRRVKLHELYREIEALGGADECADDEAYNDAIDDVLAILRASGFGEGFYIDQREYENRARVSTAAQMEAAQ